MLNKKKRCRWMRACYRIINLCSSRASIFLFYWCAQSHFQRIHTHTHTNSHALCKRALRFCPTIHFRIYELVLFMASTHRAALSIGSDETKSNLFGHFCSMIFIWSPGQKQRQKKINTMRRFEKWSTRLNPMTSLSCFFSMCAED